MKRPATPTFVLTIPLVVKAGEDRIMTGRMEAGRRLYNATLGEALRRHGLMKQSKAWQHARTITDKKERGLEFRHLSKEAGFTPAAIITFARNCKNEAGWKDRLGSNVTQRIAEQVFAAMQQYSFGKRGRPRFKGASRPLHSLEATTNAAKSSGSRKRVVSSLATSRSRPCCHPKHKTHTCPGTDRQNEVLSRAMTQRERCTPLVCAAHARRYCPGQTRRRGRFGSRPGHWPEHRSSGGG